MRIIDATDLILGRLATQVAKLSLEGEKVVILNSEKAIITGTKNDIFDKYLSLRQKGEPFHGPFYPKQSDRLVKRTIRGMLPHKQEKGRKALKRITCYKGIPIQFQDKEIQTLESASIDKLSMGKYLKVEELVRRLGGK